MSQQPFEMHKSPSLASAPPPTIAVKATQVNVTKIIVKQDLSFSLQQIGFGFFTFWSSLKPEEPTDASASENMNLTEK